MKKWFYSSSLVLLFITGCASKPEPQPSSIVYRLPACKVILDEKSAAGLREHLLVDVNHIGNVVNLPAGYGLIKLPPAP